MFISHPPSTPSDEQNSAALSPAQAERLDNLVRRSRGLLARLCRSQTRTRDDADELESATLLAVCRRFAGYDPSKGAFGSWLGAIVKSEASDLRKKAMRQPPLAPNCPAVQAAMEQVPDEGVACDIYEAPSEFDDLPLVARQALGLVGFQGFTSAEAAVRLGLTEGTVRTYLWRARKRMRQPLGGAA